jgi:ribosomal protein L11 methyltransferase
VAAKWLSVALETDAAHAEALTDALLAAGALSASVEDALAGSAFETPQFDEPAAGGAGRAVEPVRPLWEKSRVTALFEPADDLSARIDAALRAAGMVETPALAFSEVMDADWVRLTQAQFTPIEISPRLWIVPSWHRPPDPAAINLILDPGLAFGTGSHPTTRLCLAWLEAHVTPGVSVLDYGCGSGILAIAAKKLGAGDTAGVDIDPDALAAARENAARNDVEIRLMPSSAALSETFDLVVANILTNPLMLLAPVLGARLNPGGRLALSGVLETQADQVIAAYAPWLPLSIGAVEEGWVRLEGVHA